jgi:hypothetical protein
MLFPLGARARGRDSRPGRIAPDLRNEERILMRKLLSVLSISLLAMGAAGQAGATVLAFSSGSSLGIALATLPPVLIAGTGVATVNGSAAGAHLNSLALGASPFATNGFVLPVTDPVAAPIKGLQLTAHNGDANFTGGTGAGGVLHGQMPIVGNTKVCLFGPCSNAVQNLVVPLTVVGQGGNATVGTSVNITAIGAPWTLGTAQVGTVSMTGFRHGAASLTSSTVGVNGGAVRLVTPVFVSTNIPASAVVPVFGILDLKFVPEPGTLLLLGSGIAGLVLTGRKRARAASS